MTVPRFCIERIMSILRDHRPENIRPKMSTADRAKQFAPFAALGRMDAVLKRVERTRDTGDLERVADWSQLPPDEIEKLKSEGRTCPVSEDIEKLTTEEMAELTAEEAELLMPEEINGSF